MSTQLSDILRLELHNEIKNTLLEDEWFCYNEEREKQQELESQNLNDLSFLHESFLRRSRNQKVGFSQETKKKKNFFKFVSTNCPKLRELSLVNSKLGNVDGFFFSSSSSSSSFSSPSSSFSSSQSLPPWSALRVLDLRRNCLVKLPSHPLCDVVPFLYELRLSSQLGDENLSPREILRWTAGCVLGFLEVDQLPGGKFESFASDLFESCLFVAAINEKLLLHEVILTTTNSSSSSSSSSWIGGVQECDDRQKLIESQISTSLLQPSRETKERLERQKSFSQRRLRIQGKNPKSGPSNPSYSPDDLKFFEMIDAALELCRYHFRRAERATKTPSSAGISLHLREVNLANLFFDVRKLEHECWSSKKVNVFEEITGKQHEQEQEGENEEKLPEEITSKMFCFVTCYDDVVDDDDQLDRRQRGQKNGSSTGRQLSLDSLPHWVSSRIVSSSSSSSSSTHASPSSSRRRQIVDTSRVKSSSNNQSKLNASSSSSSSTSVISYNQQQHLQEGGEERNTSQDEEAEASFQEHNLSNISVSSRPGSSFLRRSHHHHHHHENQGGGGGQYEQEQQQEEEVTEKNYVLHRTMSAGNTVRRPNNSLSQYYHHLLQQQQHQQNQSHHLQNNSVFEDDEDDGGEGGEEETLFSSVSPIPPFHSTRPHTATIATTTTAAASTTPTPTSSHISRVFLLREQATSPHAVDSAANLSGMLLKLDEDDRNNTSSTSDPSHSHSHLNQTSEMLSASSPLRLNYNHHNHSRDEHHQSSSHNNNNNSLYDPSNPVSKEELLKRNALKRRILSASSLRSTFRERTFTRAEKPSVDDPFVFIEPAVGVGARYRVSKVELEKEYLLVSKVDIDKELYSDGFLKAPKVLAVKFENLNRGSSCWVSQKAHPPPIDLPQSCNNTHVSTNFLEERRNYVPFHRFIREQRMREGSGFARYDKLIHDIDQVVSALGEKVRPENPYEKKMKMKKQEEETEKVVAVKVVSPRSHRTLMEKKKKEEKERLEKFAYSEKARIRAKETKMQMIRRQQQQQQLQNHAAAASPSSLLIAGSYSQKNSSSLLSSSSSITHSPAAAASSQVDSSAEHVSHSFSSFRRATSAGRQRQFLPHPAVRQFFTATQIGK